MRKDQELGELTSIGGYLRSIVNTKYPVLKTEKFKKCCTIDIKRRVTSLLAYILKNPIHCSYKIWKLFQHGDIRCLKFLKLDEFETIGKTNFTDIETTIPLHELNSDYQAI